MTDDRLHCVGTVASGKTARVLQLAKMAHELGHRVVLADHCARGDDCPWHGTSFSMVLRAWTPDGIEEPRLCFGCQHDVTRPL